MASPGNPDVHPSQHRRRFSFHTAQAINTRELNNDNAIFKPRCRRCRWRDSGSRFSRRRADQGIVPAQGRIGLGALAGSGAILAALPSLASAAATTDVDILNFALTLEYLESAFYGEAVMKGALSGETKTFAKVVAGHEAAHVAALKGALGSRGREAEVRLQRNDREPGEVPGHLRGTRVHRRQRLPRPGRQHHLQEGARRRRIDPPGRGLARRLDRRPPPPRRQALPCTDGLRHRQDHGADPRGGQRHRLHRRLGPSRPGGGSSPSPGTTSRRESAALVTPPDETPASRYPHRRRPVGVRASFAPTDGWSGSTSHPSTRRLASYPATSRRRFR